MSHFDRLARALELLLQERSPRIMAAHLTAPERSMLRMAQLIRGSHAVPPSTEFVSMLRARVQNPTRKIDRRTVLSSIGAMAAGLVGGVGLDRGIPHGVSSSPFPQPQPIVGEEGTWFAVAAARDVPEGTIQSFTAGAVRGVLIYQHGKLWAVSRTCTHMGCILSFEPEQQKLVCPCHGAEYNLQGTPEVGPRYPPNLRPLPEVEVRVKAEKIEVHGA